MVGNYQKDIYKQLMEAMSKVDSLESEQRQNCKEIKSLSNKVASISKENTTLREEISSLKQENTLLCNDNKQMKRILGNEISNSSNPPSRDWNTKPANMYNGRKTTSRKPGAQRSWAVKSSCRRKNP